MAGHVRPRVVALIGVPGSGKAAVARRMIGAGFHRLRFADPAREMLTAAFGLTQQEIDGPTRERSQRRFGGHSTSLLMSSLIEDWGRRCVHSDLWSNELRRRADLIAERHPGEATYIVVEDLRRPGEANAIKDMGGIIVRITRPDYTPPSSYAAVKLEKLEADLELINRSPEALAAQTDAFILSLGSTLASKAA